jgi:hypothetical protein
MRERVTGLAAQLGLAERLLRVVAWLEKLDEPAIALYAAASRDQARQLITAFRDDDGR